MECNEDVLGDREGGGESVGVWIGLVMLTLMAAGSFVSHRARLEPPSEDLRRG